MFNVTNHTHFVYSAVERRALATWAANGFNLVRNFVWWMDTNARRRTGRCSWRLGSTSNSSNSILQTARAPGALFAGRLSLFVGGSYWAGLRFCGDGGLDGRVWI